MIIPMIGAVFSAIAAVSIISPYRLKIRQYDCENKKIPASFLGKTVLFASDLHCGKHFTLGRARGLVKRINLLNPDIVVFGGDYVNSGSKMAADLFKELKKVDAQIAKFGVLGNHDYEHAEAEVKKGMRDAGIKMLDGRGYWIKVGNDRIRIGGTVDPSSGKESGISKALKGASENDFRVIISHNPAFADEIIPGSVDLMLSGHTHGAGQFPPFGLLGSMFPSGYGPRYCRKIISRNGADVFVSSGVGTVHLPLRLMSSPEIALITLREPVN
jgi:hypothetical protein